MALKDYNNQKQRKVTPNQKNTAVELRKGHGGHHSVKKVTAAQRSGNTATKPSKRFASPRPRAAELPILGHSLFRIPRVRPMALALGAYKASDGLTNDASDIRKATASWRKRSFATQPLSQVLTQNCTRTAGNHVSLPNN